MGLSDSEFPRWVRTGDKVTVNEDGDLFLDGAAILEGPRPKARGLTTPVYFEPLVCPKGPWLAGLRRRTGGLGSESPGRGRGLRTGSTRPLERGSSRRFGRPRR